jgi:hypothetical protein
MQNFVQGLLRVFGVSPATLFRNLAKLSSQTMRGLAYGYVPTSDTSGLMTVTLLGRRDIAPVVWSATAGGMEVVFDTCRAVGTVQDGTVVEDGVRNSAEFRLTWRTHG